MVAGCFRNALALVGLVVVLVALNLSVRATSAFSFSSSEQGGVMWSFDCDWKGNDIDRAAGMGDTCGKQCLDRADCTHWTWTAENGGSCWLKGAINATELVAAKGTSCGYRVTDSATGNPYTGVQQYLNPEYKASVEAAMRAATREDAPFFASVADHPTAVWLDTMAKLDTIQGHLDAAAAQAGGNPILVQFVIYDLPGRDCKAWSSNGEIPKGGLDTYKANYIDVAVARLINKAANVRLSLVIEPDSLPNIATNMGTNRCDAATEQEYMEGVAYAIAELSQIPDTTLYLDSGFGGWLAGPLLPSLRFALFPSPFPATLIRSPSNARAGWPEVMKRDMAVYMKVLARARQIRESAKIRGFASNVANYSPLFASDDGCPASEKCPLAQNPSTGEMCYDWNPCIDENRFTARLNAFLGAAGLPTRWIVDTSRSGVAGIRTRWGSWCNVKNAGVGERPEADPANAPQVDAVVWIKPPGESDGHAKEISEPIPVDRECDPLDPLGLDALADAPRAGQWFQEQFAMLVRNANPPMASGTVDPCMFDPQTNPACDPFWENLAVEYSPQYKFHPDETIWPITIDEYLTHVTASKGIFTEEDGTEYEVEYQTGPITPDNLDTLLENPNLKSEHGSTVLFSSEEFHQETPWVTDSARNPENGGTKLYTVIYNPKPDDKDSFVEIQYWLFYPYNYVHPLAGDDNHVTDLVAIAIRFSKTGQPQRIWYAQHDDGPVWAWDQGADWDDPKPSEFATVMGTHPIVYVSEGNHEHYPGAGE
ncbi:unnamed protein product [Closterium sp. Naga37s-1]|nr:unnamed protein product [Closterium sp. Naga37s-1]